MRFVIRNPGEEESFPTVASYPTAELWRDYWEDYGYNTMFQVRLHLAPDRILELDNVKIFRRGLQTGATELPSPFSELDDDYCSLGQATSYYELLKSAGKAVYSPFLRGLRDMAFMSRVRKTFSADTGVQKSLLRFGAAKRALALAPLLLDPRASLAREPLSFAYQLPGTSAPTEFQFADTDDLPSRLAVVIGYNGAGKTNMLANLAMLAYQDDQEMADKNFIRKYGRWVGRSPNFGAIIAISYSAFDVFAVPRARRPTTAVQRSPATPSVARNYTYCGLRQKLASGRMSPSLKSIEQLTRDFYAARDRALGKERVQSLKAAIEPIAAEPSFQALVDLPDITAHNINWRRTFGQLSTGHKIVLNIVVQLCAHLERGAIVLFDEPELHLHPPLLAALLRSLCVLLDQHDSFAIIATHSPVVLQEVPRRNVKVLHRNLDSLTIESPDIETFAENIGLLTTHVFSLDSSNTDYQGVLRKLAGSYSIDEINDLFDGRMSSQARNLVMSIQRSEQPDAGG